MNLNVVEPPVTSKRIALSAIVWSFLIAGPTFLFALSQFSQFPYPNYFNALFVCIFLVSAALLGRTLGKKLLFPLLLIVYPLVFLLLKGTYAMSLVPLAAIFVLIACFTVSRLNKRATLFRNWTPKAFVSALVIAVLLGWGLLFGIYTFYRKSGWPQTSWTEAYHCAFLQTTYRLGWETCNNDGCSCTAGNRLF